MGIKNRQTADFQNKSTATNSDAPVIHLLLPAVDYKCPQRPILTIIQRKLTHSRMFHNIPCTQPLVSSQVPCREK